MIQIKDAEQIKARADRLPNAAKTSSEQTENPTTAEDMEGISSIHTHSRVLLLNLGTTCTEFTLVPSLFLHTYKTSLNVSLASKSGG